MNNKIKILSWLFLLVSAGIALAEPVWKISKTEMKILGTSNLHDWEMKVMEAESRHEIQLTNGQLIIKKVELTIPVNSIESGYVIMNNKTREALNASQYPEISFVGGENVLTVSGNSFKGTIKGRLQIAGKTRDVEIPIIGKVTSERIITISGDYQIDMTHYDVIPPTAFFKTLKTGKDVVVSFTFELYLTEK